MALFALGAVLQPAGAQDAAECAGKPATIAGTDGPDQLTGTDAIDVIAGGAGDDVITGLEQNDLLCGGPGDDRFLVDANDDVIDGEAGTDTISFASAVSVTVELGVRGLRGSAAATGRDTSGRDVIEGVENVQGSPGADTIAGGPAVNRLDAGAGDDTFIYFPADRGDDVWLGGPGADTAEFERAQGKTTVDLTVGAAAVTGARTGTDRLDGVEHANGSFFDDVLRGDGAANHFSGNSENIFTGRVVQLGLTGDADRLEGGGGPDRLHTSVGPSTLEGGEGDDYLRAFPQRPVTMTGGPGNDEMASGAGPGTTAPYTAAATYSGGPGADVIHGTNGNDTLSGDEDNDTLVGADGDDRLAGGPGDADSGSGDAGTDVCDDAIETARYCAHGGNPDDFTTAPAYTTAETNVNVVLEPGPGDTEGDYVVTVANTGTDTATDVRVRVFFAGRVFQDSLAPECSLGTGFATTAEVQCHLQSLPPGAAGARTLRITGDEMDEPTHMAVAYHAPSSYQSGPPNDVVWDDNIAVYEFIPTVVVTGLEVTQGLQNLRGDVPLIEGRKTWVRVHARSGASSAAFGVRAELHAVDLKTNRTKVFAASNGSPLRIPEFPNRLSDTEVFRFELPPGWWRGDVVFRVRLPGQDYSCRDPAGDCRIAAVFRKGPSIDLQLVAIPWVEANGRRHVPTASDMSVAALQAQAVLPVVDVRSRFTHTLDPWWLPKGNPGLSDFWMNRLLGMLDRDRWWTGCKAPLSARCLEVGLLVDPPNANNALLGLSFVPADEALAFLDADLTLVHELGHALGRQHTRCTGGEAAPDSAYPYPDGRIGIGSDERAEVPEAYWGADLYGTGQYFGRNRFTYFHAAGARDLMAYCAPRWIGHTTYAAIRRELESRFGVASTSVGVAAARRPALLVSGVVGPNAKADQIFAVDEGRAAPTRARRGTHSVRMFDGSGDVIARAAFTPQHTEGGRHAAFAVVLPARAAAARVALYRGNKRLDVLRESAHDPKVTVTAPRARARLKGKRVTVRWKARDADGDRLTYAVQYSSNNGRTWTSVGLDLRERAVRIPRARLAKSRRARFRVTASDGFRSTSAVSGRVRVAKSGR